MKIKTKIKVYKLMLSREVRCNCKILVFKKIKRIILTIKGQSYLIIYRIKSLQMPPTVMDFHNLAAKMKMDHTSRSRKCHLRAQVIVPILLSRRRTN